jgi:signal transduction histidine kinase
MFERLGDIYLRATGGSGKRYLLLLVGILALVCAFLPNATTVILVAPVIVRVEASDGGVLLLVEDEGPGVPEEMREAIFEPFRQGPDAPEHSPGVGVGLTLVRRFAELHGGRAWVEERAGGGASFRVFLPGESG